MVLFGCLNSAFISRWSLQEMCLEAADPGSSCPVTLGTALLRQTCLSTLACRLCITPKIPVSLWPLVSRWGRGLWCTHFITASLQNRPSSVILSHLHNYNYDLLGFIIMHAVCSSPCAQISQAQIVLENFWDCCCVSCSPPSTPEQPEEFFECFL